MWRQMHYLTCWNCLKLDMHPCCTMYFYWVDIFTVNGYKPLLRRSWFGHSSTSYYGYWWRWASVSSWHSIWSWRGRVPDSSRRWSQPWWPVGTASRWTWKDVSITSRHAWSCCLEGPNIAHANIGTLKIVPLPNQLVSLSFLDNCLLCTYMQYIHSTQIIIVDTLVTYGLKNSTSSNTLG